MCVCVGGGDSCVGECRGGGGALVCVSVGGS